jgi:holliday junction DNA helicase RuvB
MILSNTENSKKNPKNQPEIEKLQDKSLDEEQNLRPNRLVGFIGQSKLKKQLQIILDSAKIREKLPEHILFYGQPGLGKTTLASLISSEMGVNFKVASAPSIQKQGDLVSLLLNLENKTILFIDEIHRLKAPLEETLYTAMEDGQVDLLMGKGAGAQSARLDLPEFTLVGATTMLGKISKPLKDRFPTIFQLEKYDDKEIIKLINLNSEKLDLKIDQEAKEYICKRCRGVPRITNNILKRVLDYQIVHHLEKIDLKNVKFFLEDLGIYTFGLTKSDTKYLEILLQDSMGLKSLSSILMEEKDTVELVIEPYLMHLGFINKSSLGRKLTPKGRLFIREFLGKEKDKVLI